MAEISLGVGDVEFVKELYPRVREDDAAIERYRAAIDRLPPIVVARGRVLVDGFHRWQAHKRERLEVIAAEDLGDIPDAEILRQAYKRNATHGQQLSTGDKRTAAEHLYFMLGGTSDEKYGEISDLLAITVETAKTYAAKARAHEREQQQENALDLWLDCCTPTQVEATVGVTDQTVANWISKFLKNPLFREAPESRQHFDVWSFTKADGDSSYFGKLPPQVAENLLWLYTEPGQIVVDPFAGGGTVIDVAKRMGRRVWASDRKPSTPTLPIHEHDARSGWPREAPRKADLVILDPPYWQQAKGRYSDDDADLGNQPLEGFYAAWEMVAKAAMEHTGRIAYIISPTQLEDGTVVDHATDMLAPFTGNGWRVERRIIVTYQTQQATGQQVEWARKEKKLLKLYRDLVVMTG